MVNYIYETHSMENPLLPFIYHKRLVVTQRKTLPNWHENLEILQCIAGKGYVQCGLQKFDFVKGDLFVVNPNTPHCTCSEGCIVTRCLILDNTFCAANGIASENLHFVNLIRDEALFEAFNAVAEAYEGQDEPWAVTNIRYAVLGLLRQLCTGYSTEKTEDAQAEASSNHIRAALTYIRQNIAKPLSLDLIAESTGISKYYLSREFKAFTGKTIVQTVNLIRCVEARRMIESGENVSQAAANCGFENLSYFTRTFKKHFGVLPSSLLAGGKSQNLRDPSAEDANCYC